MTARPAHSGFSCPEPAPAAPTVALTRLLLKGHYRDRPGAAPCCAAPTAAAPSAVRGFGRRACNRPTGLPRRCPPPTAAPLLQPPRGTHLVQKLGDIVDAVVQDDPGALAVVVLLHLLQPVVPAPPRLAPGLAGAHHVPHDSRRRRLLSRLQPCSHARPPTGAQPQAYQRPPPPPRHRPPPRRRLTHWRSQMPFKEGVGLATEVARGGGTCEVGRRPRAPPSPPPSPRRRGSERRPPRDQPPVTCRAGTR